ncbi:DUF2164 domain-containing protein [Roseibium denhamense]|nr:DUF2164 domain-containing protein [Roseibium denhamense]MTI06019.1 DUF2164 domain-containing protein [Roseibium denhamense]
MTDFKLDPETRTKLSNEIRRYLDEELEIGIGNMDADMLIEFISEHLGAHFYNLGLKDAQALIARRADDIADELYAMEKPVRE